MRDLYKVDDLGYAVCFEAKDKFLVGPINNKRTKIKDIKSGEIIEFRKDTNNFGQLSSCVEGDLLKIMSGVRQVRGLETSLYNVSIMQKAHAKQVQDIINKGVLSTGDIFKIKSIMNSEIEKNQSREANGFKSFQDIFNSLNIEERKKSQKRSNKKDCFAMSEEEREF